jgi:hypothetical protein
LNAFVAYPYFKIETIHDTIQPIRPNDYMYMASLNLKECAENAHARTTQTESLGVFLSTLKIGPENDSGHCVSCVLP